MNIDLSQFDRLAAGQSYLSVRIVASDGLGALLLIKHDGHYDFLLTPGGGKPPVLAVDWDRGERPIVVCYDVAAPLGAMGDRLLGAYRTGGEEQFCDACLALLFGDDDDGG